MPRPRIVIVGGGFGGLNAARALRKADVDVELVDKRNFHLFQPLLYQVATGGLSPANIAAPLRTVLAGQENVRIHLAAAEEFDVASRRLLLEGGAELEYDRLVVAAGTVNHYFGHDDWEASAPGLKTLEEAFDIRRRILLAFEAAERETDGEARRAWLTFVVVGGGPTGVELAGTLGEMARYTLQREFRAIDPASARILLLEGEDRILGTFDEDLAAIAVRDLGELGVEVRTATLVTDIRDGACTVRARDGDEETIPARTVLWAAGQRGSPLGGRLADATGAERDGLGRLYVRADLTLPGHPEIFVLGDLAHCRGRDGEPLPAVAPVAIQQGRYAARRIRASLEGRGLRSFKYKDRGSMATIGRTRAIAEVKGFRFSGYFAWLVWLFVHLIQLVRFQNRVLVLFQWAWNYFTYSRTARLITPETKPRTEEERTP